MYIYIIYIHITICRYYIVKSVCRLPILNNLTTAFLAYDVLKHWKSDSSSKYTPSATCRDKDKINQEKIIKCDKTFEYLAMLSVFQGVSL